MWFSCGFSVRDVDIVVVSHICGTTNNLVYYVLCNVQLIGYEYNCLLICTDFQVDRNVGYGYAKHYYVDQSLLNKVQLYGDLGLFIVIFQIEKS